LPESFEKDPTTCLVRFCEEFLKGLTSDLLDRRGGLWEAILLEFGKLKSNLFATCPVSDSPNLAGQGNFSSRNGPVNNSTDRKGLALTLLGHISLREIQKRVAESLGKGLTDPFFDDTRSSLIKELVTTPARTWEQISLDSFRAIELLVKARVEGEIEEKFKRGKTTGLQTAAK